MDGRRFFLITILLAGSWFYGLAQQKPQYTQYVLNQYILNPALTGIENYVDVKCSYRRQWQGLEGAPVTSYFTIQGPLNKKDERLTATSYPMDGENPRGRYYWENYEATKPHHGIGLQVINDRTGAINQFSAYATYAYHIGISPRTSLALGFGAGLINSSLDASGLDFGSGAPSDPVLGGGSKLHSLHPDFTAGIYLYSGDYFAGISAQQLIPQKDPFGTAVSAGNGGGAGSGGTGGSASAPNFFATAGYRFLLDEDWNLIPSVLVKKVAPTPVSFDINAKLQYRYLCWIGASYRRGDGFAAMAGLNISNTVNVGYSYDYTTSGLNSVSYGSHEITIGLLLGNKFGDWCPKNVW